MTSEVGLVKAADQKHCYSCGGILHISTQHCPRCGAVQPKATLYDLNVVNSDSQLTSERKVPSGQQVFCRGCGMVIHSTARTCPKCGAVQQTGGFPVVDLVGGKNKTTAGLLGILLGGVGAHKFYLERIFQGLIYLVFMWTFVPAIIGLVEGVYYLTLSDFDFERKFGN